MDKLKLLAASSAHRLPAARPAVPCFYEHGIKCRRPNAERLFVIFDQKLNDHACRAKTLLTSERRFSALLLWLVGGVASDDAKRVVHTASVLKKGRAGIGLQRRA
jgi:hypothetical protein